MNKLDAISQAVESGDDREVVKLTEESLVDDIPALDILYQGLIPGMQSLAKLFQDGEAFLPEILISKRAMDCGLEKLQPYLVNVTIQSKGTVVLGTVEGDLHDIGKNLVGMMLSSDGFNVIDIGVDVSAADFVKAAMDSEADIVALSGLLTTTTAHFASVIGALEEADLRGKVKVMVGGAPVTREYADEIGAEGFADDCAAAVDEAIRLMES